MGMQYWWKDNDIRKLSSYRKTCPSVTLFTTNLMGIALG